MTTTLLSGAEDFVSLVVGSATSLISALGTVAKDLRIAGPIALGIIHTDVEWLGMVLVFIGTILAVPLVRVLHSFVDDAAGVFTSWKANRNAAVRAADAFRLPTKVKQFFVKPLLVGGAACPALTPRCSSLV